MSDAVGIFSGEFWAAGFGASAAFALEALRQWRARIRADQAAANNATSALAQMYSQIQNLRQQVYEEQAEKVRKIMKREPLPFEYIPMVGVSDFGLRLDLQSLSFLNRTHDPDLLNRLATTERSFISDITHEQRRASLHVEFQRRMALAGVGSGATLTGAQLEQIVGFDLLSQLGMLTDAQVQGLPKTSDLILKTQRELVDVVSVHFPTGRFIRFEPMPHENASKHPRRQAAWWRRALRTVVKKIRALTKPA